MEKALEIFLTIILTPICVFLFLSYFAVIVDRQVWLVTALYGKVFPMEVVYPDGIQVDETLSILNITKKQLKRLVEKGRIRTYLRNDILHCFTEDVRKFEPEAFDPKYAINDPFDFIEDDASTQRG
tara:strand:+ start:30150 stop:30527 length:378 start_codon:yes stop_codon:yes gene_type:complete